MTGSEKLLLAVAHGLNAVEGRKVTDGVVLNLSDSSGGSDDAISVFVPDHAIVAWADYTDDQQREEAILSLGVFTESV